ncbi:uncharacterized protein TNCV_4876151 [Trichonephila clavipes]|uniref:Transposase n=1 Tax=Trichonephila clavipes TaxID=2585209 RepID=A0A8X6UYQ5_TRICX|nr:uncharacterized protein TNCV_4876151 [Trichonephila clavipes]
MITNFFIPELNNHDVQELWFQQDDATCHIARATIDFFERHSLVYADKPQTLDHLEDNIHRVIADIRPQMLEKVIESWTYRLDYIRASRSSPMPEIIFKIDEAPFWLNGYVNKPNGRIWSEANPQVYVETPLHPEKLTDCLVRFMGWWNPSSKTMKATTLQSMSLVYADKPQTLDHLEDNIRRVIADKRPQMLEKVIENWTSRLDSIRASRGSAMPEIIFKM